MSLTACVLVGGHDGVELIERLGQVLDVLAVGALVGQLRVEVVERRSTRVQYVLELGLESVELGLLELELLVVQVDEILELVDAHGHVLAVGELPVELGELELVLVAVDERPVGDVGRRALVHLRHARQLDLVVQRLELEALVDLLLQVGDLVEQILQLQVVLVDLVLLLVRANARPVDAYVAEPIELLERGGEHEAALVLVAYERLVRLRILLLLQALDVANDRLELLDDEHLQLAAARRQLLVGGVGVGRIRIAVRVQVLVERLLVYVVHGERVLLLLLLLLSGRCARSLRVGERVASRCGGGVLFDDRRWRLETVGRCRCRCRCRLGIRLMVDLIDGLLLSAA